MSDRSLTIATSRDIEASPSPSRPDSCRALHPVLSHDSLGTLQMHAIPQLSLPAILAGKTESPVALEDLREFLLKEDQGAEALDYYLAVEHYRLVLETESEDDKRSSSLTSSMSHLLDRDGASILDFIIYQFIKAGSAEEISMSTDDRQAIITAHKNGQCTLDLLLPSQRQCYEFLLKTSYPRFQLKATRNIGPRESSARMSLAIFGGTMIIALILLSLLLPAYPRGLRWLIIIPANAAFIGLFQWRARFCVIYGMRGLARWKGFGLFGFVRRDDNVAVREPCVRTAHRHRALMLMGISLLLAILVAGVVYAVPVNT